MADRHFDTHSLIQTNRLLCRVMCNLFDSTTSDVEFLIADAEILIFRIFNLDDFGIIFKKNILLLSNSGVFVHDYAHAICHGRFTTCHGRATFTTVWCTQWSSPC